MESKMWMIEEAAVIQLIVWHESHFRFVNIIWVQWCVLFVFKDSKVTKTSTARYNQHSRPSPTFTSRPTSTTYSNNPNNAQKKKKKKKRRKQSDKSTKTMLELIIFLLKIIYSLRNHMHPHLSIWYSILYMFEIILEFRLTRQKKIGC